MEDFDSPVFTEGGGIQMHENNEFNELESTIHKIIKESDVIQNRTAESIVDFI